MTRYKRAKIRELSNLTPRVFDELLATLPLAAESLPAYIIAEWLKNMSALIDAKIARHCEES